MARKPIKFLSHEMQLAVLFVNDYCVRRVVATKTIL